MKKLLTRIVLLLSVLLLGSQATAFARTGKTQANTLAVKALSLQHDVTLNNALALDSAHYTTTLAPYQKQVEKVDPTDTEEEEESQTASKKLSLKKQTAAAPYFQAAFAVSAPQQHTIKKRTDNFPRFSYAIANRWYILFRVIRI